MTTTQGIVAPTKQKSAAQIAADQARQLTKLEEDLVSRDVVTSAIAQGGKALTDYVGKASGLYAAQTSVETAVKGKRTVTAAYVVRGASAIPSPDKPNKFLTNAEIAAYLPDAHGKDGKVSGSRVSQLRVTATLLVDFGFDPADEATWQPLSSKWQNEKTVAAAIREELARALKEGDAPQQKPVLDAMATAIAGVAKTSGTRSGSPNSELGDSDTTVPVSNAGRIDQVERLLASMQALSPMEFARVADLTERIEALLAAQTSEAAEAGWAEVGKRKAAAEREAAKAEQTQQSAE